MASGSASLGLSLLVLWSLIKEEGYLTVEAIATAVMSSTQKGNCSFVKGLCTRLRACADSIAGLV